MNRPNANPLWDERAAAVVESSRLWSLGAAAMTRLSAAVDSSAVVARCCAARDSWLSLHWSVRRRLSGTTLITAALTHVLLNLGLGTPVGTFWLFIPVTVIVFGLLLLAVSSPRARRSGTID